MLHFWSYQTNYDKFLQGRVKTSPELERVWKRDHQAFYSCLKQQLYNDFKHEIDESELSVHSERLYLDYGRPYYKIWPGIAYAMTRTELKVDPFFLHFPYPSFQIQFPKDNSLPLFNYYKALIVQGFKKEDFHLFAIQKDLEKLTHHKVTKILYMFWESNKYPNSDRYDYTYLPLRDGESIEKAVNYLDMGDNWVTGKRYSTPIYQEFDDFKDLIKIVLCTIFFAIGEHEMVLPDVKTKIIDKRYLGRGKAKLKIAQQKIERPILKCKGWRVGSEIDLPRPVILRSEKESAETRELSHGHIRSGHLRMQPCGPKHEDRKVVWIAPTVIRPDLPLRNTHGYRVGRR